MMTKKENSFIEETENHITEVRNRLIEFMLEISNRSFNHDKSKLEEVEAPYFEKYTPMLKGVKYGSDEYKEMLDGLKPALDHHYSNNSHHPEHYKDGFKGMNLVDLVELICDWDASTKRGKDGDILTSIEKNQDRFKYSDDVKKILENTVKYLKWDKNKND